MDDDDAWDGVVRFVLKTAGGLGLAALYYIDLTIADVHWTRSALIALIVAGCYIGRLGVWTMRKIAIALTVYAGGYLVGALPSIQSIGAYLARLIA
jgi:hypothetical protein